MAVASMTTTTQRLLWRPTLELSARFQPTATTRRRIPSITSLAGRPYSTQRPKRSDNAVKFWPFLVIIAMGTGAYVLLARTRAENRYTSGRRPQ
ncbi:hypothetical protein F5X99DRAFT_397327 [Biscogniauxia marginata]|nr:hypothetical protein F5X99DRAFT_397327 [Biscogniauxia marginata]